MAKQKRLVFLPLGGSGEIGMNLNLFGYGAPDQEKWIMVDCGITFGSNDTPGVDIILPDYEFIKERRENLSAIILTHAHEDHIGAIAHIWPDLRVPMYATPFTARMMMDKFKDLGVKTDGFLHTIPLKSNLTLGDFKVEFVSITHSIPEPNGLFIQTPTASVYHTGDWKFDPNPVLGDATDHERISEIAKIGVDACICDSTNALDKGVAGSEADILEPMIEAIKGCQGRVAITTFASNVARMKTLMQATIKAGRKFTLCGRSAERIYAHGREMNYFGGLPDPVALEDAMKEAKADIVCICTGSQGESRSALGRMSTDTHPYFRLDEGDTVIFSSKTIPGNEKAIFGMYNRLSEKNVNIITSKSFDIHVSGHPCEQELAQLYEILKPTSSIPVHGEIRHMNRHAEIALEHGADYAIVPQNGDIIEITKQGVSCDSEVEAGRIYVDGNIKEEAKSGSCAERRRLVYAGYAAMTVNVDMDGNLLDYPTIQTFGVPTSQALFGSAGEGYLQKQLIDVYENLDYHDYADDKKLSEAFRMGYRRIINRAWGKKPITSVKVNRLDVALRRRRKKR